MKVRLKHWHAPTRLGPGVVIDLPDAQALALVRVGGATSVEAAEPAEPAEKPDTAATEESKPRPKRRRRAAEVPTA